MVIKLYIDYASQPSRSVLALCLIGNIPHQIIEVSMFKGQQRSSQFIKINPMKKVPAIVDTDNRLCLAESHSILKYLCTKYNLPESWYPRKDYVRQAKINQFLDFHHTNTRKCSYLTFHTLFAPLLKIGDPTFNSDYTFKIVKYSLKMFQQIYLNDSRFIYGDVPSIADIIAFYDITMIELLDFDYSNYPQIVRWISDMRKIKEIEKANEKFNESKQSLKSLRPTPSAKL